MSSSNKSTSLSVSNIPRFNGRNFQGWVEKMIGVFMMAKVYNVVNGTTTKPADTEVPVAPTEPPEIAATTNSTVALRSQAMWQQYNICMSKYHHLVSEYNRRNAGEGRADAERV